MDLTEMQVKLIKSIKRVKNKLVKSGSPNEFFGCNELRMLEKKYLDGTERCFEYSHLRNLISDFDRRCLDFYFQNKK